MRFLALRILRAADSGHGSRLAQTHVTVVLDVILQPRRNARAASTGRNSSHCGGHGLVSISTFFGVAVVFGVPVSIVLGAIAATRFPEKEGKRERDPETHISSFGRTCEAKKGADTEKENQSILHGGANRRAYPRTSRPEREARNNAEKADDAVSAPSVKNGLRQQSYSSSSSRRRQRLWRDDEDEYDLLMQFIAWNVANG